MITLHESVLVEILNDMGYPILPRTMTRHELKYITYFLLGQGIKLVKHKDFNFYRLTWDDARLETMARLKYHRINTLDWVNYADSDQYESIL
jgi:hypothetical protein